MAARERDPSSRPAPTRHQRLAWVQSARYRRLRCVAIRPFEPIIDSLNWPRSGYRHYAARQHPDLPPSSRIAAHADHALLLARRPGTATSEAIKIVEELDLASRQPLPLDHRKVRKRIRKVLVTRHVHHGARILATDGTPGQANTALVGAVGRCVVAEPVGVNLTAACTAVYRTISVDRAYLGPRPSASPASHDSILPSGRRESPS